MNTRLLAVALMAMSVSACEQANRLEETLTGRPALVAAPAPLLAVPEPVVEPEPVAPEVVAEVHASPPPVVEPEPAPLQRGDAGYVCEPRFRELSCDDDGRPHNLGSQGEWLD